MPAWTAIEARKALWSVNTPVAVYRYLEEQWVDAFFDSGKLRLGTFAAFRRHSDEQRLDLDEGRGTIQGLADTQEGFFQTTATTGISSYIFCVCALRDQDIMKQLGYDSGFEIRNTVEFGLAIARAMTDFRLGREGHCIYVDERTLTAISDDFAVEHAGKRFPRRALDTAAQDLPFLKHRSYAHQAEYRFIWEVGAPTDAYLEIHVPEARAHCRKISFS